MVAWEIMSCRVFENSHTHIKRCFELDSERSPMSSTTVPPPKKTPRKKIPKIAKTKKQGLIMLHDSIMHAYLILYL